MKRVIFAAALTAVSIGGAMAEPVGDWRVEDGSATVRIKKCGAALCGFIAATRGAPGKDERNPDPAKRNRSVIGIEVLINLRPSGDKVWTGTSYNAEDGLIYHATVTEQSDRSIEIKGCGANGGICGSETWTRVR